MTGKLPADQRFLPLLRRPARESETGRRRKKSSVWQDITVKVPIDGKPGIVRLYLPAKESPVEIQTIRFSNNRNEVKAWDFTATTKEQGDHP